jgi:hypothetical protein
MAPTLATPRADLVSMLETTAARPEAVIVDIDPSGDGCASFLQLGHLMSCTASGFIVCHVVLPRRIELDADGRRKRRWTSGRGATHWARRFHRRAGSHRDQVLDLGTGPGSGATDIAVAHTRWLPAMAQAVTMATSAPDAARADATPPPLSNDCRDDAPGVTNRLLIGPRLSGDDAVPADDAASISARLLLEPEMQLDTQQLFHARTVLIGATHAAARDIGAQRAGCCRASS